MRGIGGGAGQAVQVDESQVEDWMLSGAGGTLEGGFSVKVLQAGTKDE